MSPVNAILSIGTTLIDRVFPNPKDAAEAKLRLMELEQNGQLAVMTAQTDINKVEAAHPSVWVAGWRGAVGWTCAAAFAFKFVLGPLFSVLMSMAGHPIELPNFDYSEMSTILLGMLGLGGLRTYEKYKGVDRGVD